MDIPVLTETLVWTLIHFLWQGVLIGLLLALALMFSPRADDAKRANYRYAAALVALLLLLLAPALTFAYQWFGYTTAVQQVVNTPLMTLMQNIEPGAGGMQITPLAMQFMLAFWAAGVSWFALKMLTAWLALLYLQRTEVHATPGWVTQQLHGLTEQMAIRRPVRVIVSGIIATPMTAGWLRPIIIIPVTLLTGLQYDQLRLLLAHELAHIRRHDYLVNVFQNLIKILLFYHPVVHWVCRILDEERELCCDHMAITCSASKLQYAKALISLQDHPQWLPALAVAATGKRSLLRRIQRILGEPAELSQAGLRQRPLVCVLSLIMGVTMLSTGITGIDSSTAAIRVTPDSAFLSAAAMGSEPAPASREMLLDELYLHARNFMQNSEFAESSSSAGVFHIRPPSSEQPERQSATAPSLHEQQNNLAQATDQALPQVRAMASALEQRQNLQQLSHSMTGLIKHTISSIGNQPEIDNSLVKLEPGLIHNGISPDFDLAADDVPEPVHKPIPKIPSRSIAQDSTTIVNLIYSIGPTGKPVDILVADDLDGYQEVFANAAVAALRQWQYPPVSVKVQKLRIRQQFIFIQPESTAGYCITGSRICARNSHRVEQLYINSNS